MQHKQTVMIIDDDEIHLYTAKGLLSSDQIEVVTHQGSFGATTQLKHVRPDLLLLDVNMPALSGAKLAEIVKPLCREMNTAIFFYSSNDEDTLRTLVATNEVQGYICKGDIAALRNKVHDYLAAMRNGADRVSGN
ncbi:response regulator [Geobacter pelophilus]|uniref:Response regulator n=1 Tax=Geoanaerobacter pelophilus TaxID=60036 RepID=A0AAW4LC62_9BACT|nr:response regulator [Geoanaerobacter pelophilus]MBT0666160.1 response regulator [Geoanaerobacter pelophilus]